MLPAFMLIVLAFVQLSLVVMTKFAVTHTAREVARVLAVDPGADANDVAAQARPFGAGALDVEVEWRADGDRRTVSVRVSDEVDGVLRIWKLNPDVATTITMLSE